MKRKLVLWTALMLIAAQAFMGSPANAAVKYETNYALRSDVAAPRAIPCAYNQAMYAQVQACWEADGDKIWMRNVDNIGLEGVLYWSNYYPSDDDLYRNGKCLVKLVDGQWGICNKNMHEASLIRFKVCDWDRSPQMCSGIVKLRT